MDDPAKFPGLFHPELRDKTRTYCVLRSSMWSRWWYPYGQQISWFGGLVRAHSDGGNGMYATAPQAEAWPHRTDQGTIKHGPL